MIIIITWSQNGTSSAQKDGSTGCPAKQVLNTLHIEHGQVTHVIHSVKHNLKWNNGPNSFPQFNEQFDNIIPNQYFY